MYLRFLLRLMLATASTIIAASVLGILLIGADVLFLHEWSYPAWSLSVPLAGIAIAWTTRHFINACIRNHHQ